MNYYEEIKRKLIDNEIYSRVKDYSKEKNRVITYFEIGRLLSEAGNKYGESIIDQYSTRLINEVGKRYDRSTLFKIRKFFIVFSNEKVAPLVPQLSWSHCLILLPIKDVNKINYYAKQVSNGKLSKRQLQTLINSKEYERLDENEKLKLINIEDENIEDLIKNPIVIKNSNNVEVIKEKTLQKLILEDIESFMKELGDSFCFIGSEYKIKIGDRYNYIDLLLYNIKYKCYVVIELKITELKKEHIGQIQTYINYIDKNLKTIEEDKTIGIIICRKNNKYIIEYCSDDRIISKEYELV